MEDLFAFQELRIRQPARLLPGRAKYEIYDSRRHLLAIAAETEGRTRLQSVARLVPRTRVLTVTSADGDPVLTLVKRDDDWSADLSDAAGGLIGRIRIGDTRRHYTLLNEADHVIGEAAGDLEVKNFSVTGSDGERYAYIRKTWAGFGKEFFTDSDHYTVTFTGPIPARYRSLIVMMPVVLDMARHGPY